MSHLLDLTLGSIGNMLKSETYAGQVVRADVSIVLVVPLRSLAPESRQIFS